MLQRGNSKLGPFIWTFSLPAKTTCPGCTKTCLSVCYVGRGFYNMPNNVLFLKNNYMLSKGANFAANMIAEIRQARIPLIRVHTSGDFYSPAYIRKWQRIARRCGSTRFYAFTRSWRKAALLKELQTFSQSHNVVLWWSADRTTHERHGVPPKTPGVRVAYLQTDDTDPVPAYADLVFRVRRKSLHKYVQGRLVCPVENGYDKWVRKMTCTDCKICFSKRKLPKRDRQYTGPQAAAAES